MAVRPVVLEYLEGNRKPALTGVGLLCALPESYRACWCAARLDQED